MKIVSHGSSPFPSELPFVDGRRHNVTSLQVPSSALAPSPWGGPGWGLQNYPDKRLKILEEFRNKNPVAANSRVLRVHLLSPEGQGVAVKRAEVCNFLSRFVPP